MTEIKTKKVDQIFFDDVKEGDEIPTLVKRYTLQKIAVFASVHGDWCPGHYDYKWAKEKFNQPAPFAYGLQITAHCSQILTDWMGPYGASQDVQESHHLPCLPGRCAHHPGQGSRKYVENGEGWVECEVWAEKQDGRISAKASGKVTLPLRRAR